MTESLLENPSTIPPDHAAREIARRRTFAIISHPDVGKTTLTEKFLLYGGAVQLAGSVTARKNQRATTSDWMELEKQRGISVSSTVLQFEYGGCVVNLLQTRTGKRLRLSNSKRLFARERETVDEAYAGDVVGLVGNYDLQIGDTLAEDASVAFDEMPRFAPEIFAYLHNDSAAKFQRFREGVAQLLKEGVAQAYELPDSPIRVALLGAVGSLQFDVLQYRLESEYGAPTRIEGAPWNVARWIRERQPSTDPVPRSEPSRPRVQIPSGATLARDVLGNWVVLLPTAWSARYLEESNPGLEVLPLPPTPRSCSHTRNLGP